LRASTTIVTALANGAACVIPCADVDTARQLAARQTPGTTLLGGERRGVKIEGFDLDNSPASYSRDRVAGKMIIFTTTNGTAALLHARGAARVLIGSLVNRQAVVQVLCADRRAVHLICAGTDGRTTSEDLLGASAIVAELSQLADVHLDLSESTAKHWRSCSAAATASSRCCGTARVGKTSSLWGSNRTSSAQRRSISSRSSRSTLPRPGESRRPPCWDWAIALASANLPATY